MRYSFVDKTTGTPGPKPAEGAPLPSNFKTQWLPRIRCNDCPGKLYTTGPGQTVENFEVHLKNRAHKDKVEERRRRQGLA